MKRWTLNRDGFDIRMQRLITEENGYNTVPHFNLFLPTSSAISGIEFWAFESCN
jgi:hypothetical protein